MDNLKLNVEEQQLHRVSENTPFMNFFDSYISQDFIRLGLLRVKGRHSIFLESKPNKVKYEVEHISSNYIIFHLVKSIPQKKNSQKFWEEKEISTITYSKRIVVISYIHAT